MCTELGWTFTEFEEADFGYLMGLHDYWQDFPPVHVLVRNHLGYEGRKPNEAETQRVLQSPELARIAAQHSDSGRAGKLKRASKREQDIFTLQKEMAAKDKAAKGKRGR